MKDLDKRKIIDNLTESEHKFKTIFENAVDGILIADMQSKKFIMVNKTFCRMLGYTAEKIKELGVMDIHPKKDFPYVLMQFKKQSKKEITLAKNIPIKRKNGSVFYTDVNSIPIKINGKMCLLGIFRDITEQKKTEDTLKKSEARFKDLVESTSDWVWAIDENGVYTYSNPKVKDLLGYTVEEILGKTPFDFMPAEESKHIAAEFGSIIKARKVFNRLENTNIRKDNRRVMLETSGVPVFDADGNFQGYRGIDRDITERKLAEKRIRHAAEEWKKTFNAIADLVFIQDADYNIVMVNKAFCDALKAKPEDIIGKKCYELLHKRNAPWPGCPFEEVHKDLKPHTTVVDDPNIGVPVLVTASPIFDEKGKLTGSVHIAKDITEQKKMEAELRKKIEDLERFQKVTVDRELKMKELKTKIKELEAKLEGKK